MPGTTWTRDLTVRGKMTFLGGALRRSVRASTLALCAVVGLLMSLPLSTSAQGCQPRPPVWINSSSAGAGRLNVTVTAGSGTLQSLAFAGGGNAQVEIDGQTRQPPFTYPVPAGIAQKSFGVVRTGGVGTPMTLSFTVTDGCGPWSTFVGGGGAAWETTVSGQVLSAGNEQPLAGAAVQIQGTNLTAMTSTDGRFSIANVPKGTQALLTAAHGFLDDRRSIQPGTSSPPLLVRLQPPASAQVQTPIGNGVVVQPETTTTGLIGASITFESVTSPGTTTIERVTMPPGVTPPPGGDAANATYFTYSTTAMTAGTTGISLPFDPNALGGADPSQLQVMRFENGAWIDYTSGVNLQTRVIQASVPNLAAGSNPPARASLRSQAAGVNVLALVRNTLRQLRSDPKPIQDTPDAGRVLVLIPGISFGCGAPWTWPSLTMLGTLDKITEQLCDATDTGGEAEPYSVVKRGCDTFGLIVGDLSQMFGPSHCGAIPEGRLQGGRVRFYSYAGNIGSSGTYLPSETRQRLETSARRLGDQLETLGLQDRTYVIVTHSLGGAVATTWAATEQNPARLAAVHSVITLDSPVNGMDGLGVWLETWAKVGTPVSNELRGGDPVTLMRGSGRRIGVVTFSNFRDKVVPSSAARLEYGCPAFMSLCTIYEEPLPGLLTGNHLEVLNSQEIRAGIKRIVAASSVRGKATQNGQPVKDATVTLDGVSMGKTSDEGELAFLAEGPYGSVRRVEVTKGTAVGSVNATLTSGTITTISVDISPPTGTLTGKVPNGVGGPEINGATVQVQGTDISTVTATVGSSRCLASRWAHARSSSQLPATRRSTMG